MYHAMQSVLYRFECAEMLRFIVTLMYVVPLSLSVCVLLLVDDIYTFLFYVKWIDQTVSIHRWFVRHKFIAANCALLSYQNCIYEWWWHTQKIWFENYIDP